MKQVRVYSGDKMVVVGNGKNVPRTAGGVVRIRGPFMDDTATFATIAGLTSDQCWRLCRAFGELASELGEYE